MVIDKLALKNLWFGQVPASIPRFGVSFQTPVLRQAFFGDGGNDWQFADPGSKVAISIHRNNDASILDVKKQFAIPYFNLRQLLTTLHRSSM